jgi:hypothetical protein
MKLLLKAKPLADVKTIGELGLGDGAVITVMLMAGGAGASPSIPAEGEKVEEEKTKVKALGQAQFWEELKSFLEERLGEETEEQPEEVLRAFRKAWKA